MTTLLYAIVAFGILIFFHELGHFIMAKAAGVRVLTFALGFGTKLVKRTWRGTEYAICAVPLGGYVKMLGEDPGEEVSTEDYAHAFTSQSVCRRFLIVVAGPVFNLVLATVIVWFLYWGEVPYLTPRVKDVPGGSPAAQAGVRPGDLIVAIDGEETRRWQDVQERVMASEGSRIELTLRREEGLVRVTVTPRRETIVSRYGDEIPLWRIGVTSAGEIATEEFGLGAAAIQAFQWTFDKCGFTLRTLVRLVEGKESIRNIGSPLLIGMEAGKQAQMGAESYFSFIAFISVILAIMNLLPIPVLDGGHLLFLAIEGLIRRPVNPRIRGAAQYLGIGILVCIMAWALYRDLDRLYYWKTKHTESPSAVAPQEPSEVPEKP